MRGAQQPLPLVDGAQHGRAEHQELQVVVRARAGAEQVVALVVAHRPVQVLARSVDAGERLLVQEAGEPVLGRGPPHRLHRHHLMIGGEVGVLEDRRDLVLAGRDLVVARLHRHADLVELRFDVRHERHRPLGDGAEVLILELLALRRLGAEQRAPGVDRGRDATGRSSDRSGSIPARDRRSSRRARLSSRTASGRAPPAWRALPSSGGAASSCRALRRSS